MWLLALTLPLGLLLGSVLASAFKSMKTTSIPVRLAIGIGAGLGISVLFNAFIEILGFAGFR